MSAVLHLAGDPATLVPPLVDGGCFGTLLGAAPEAAGPSIRVASVYATPHRGVLDGLAADTVAGRLRIPVQRKVRPGRCSRAVADFRAGTTGELAISI